MKCSKEHLLQLNDWLNEHIDLDGGEDFNRISEERIVKSEESSSPSTEPAGDVHEVDWENLCSRTDRKTISNFLNWAADIIEQLEGQPSVKSNMANNRARIFRNIADKIYRKIDKEENNDERTED